MKSKSKLQISKTDYVKTDFDIRKKISIRYISISVLTFFSKSTMLGYHDVESNHDPLATVLLYPGPGLAKLMVIAKVPNDASVVIL